MATKHFLLPIIMISFYSCSFAPKAMATEKKSCFEWAISKRQESLRTVYKGMKAILATEESKLRGDQFPYHRIHMAGVWKGQALVVVRDEELFSTAKLTIGNKIIPYDGRTSTYRIFNFDIKKKEAVELAPSLKEIFMAQLVSDPALACSSPEVSVYYRSCVHCESPTHFRLTVNFDPKSRRWTAKLPASKENAPGPEVE